MNRTRLALFDLDHTLIPFDSDYAWGAFTTELGWTDVSHFAQQNQAFYAQYQAGTLDIHAYVRFATAAIRQQGPAAAHAAHAQYMQRIVLPQILPPARALIAEHQAAGDTVVIITATNAFVTRPIAQAFGVQELLAIELEQETTAFAHPPTPWYTGAIAGTPSFREGKVLRLEAWMAQRELSWANVHTTFYSDSRNDLPLLERVDVPVATNPDAHLRALAQQRAWRILDLFPQSP